MDVSFKFFSPSPRYDTEKPYELFLDENPPDFPATNCEFVFENVKIADIRTLPSRTTLDGEGFQVLSHKSSVLCNAADIQDPAKVEAYLNQTIELVKMECDASKVICYDWRYRTSRPDSKFVGDAKDRVRPLEPAQRVHIDNTERGAVGQLRRFLTQAEANTARIRLINVWRPLCDVVEQWPLAFCDRRTISNNDQVEVDRPSSTFIDYGCYIKHSPMQKWHWLSKQSSSEPFMFLVWDSSSGVGAAHGAFRNPVASNDDARHSIEVRLIVLNERDPKDHAGGSG
ncbi:hypothetical protein B0T16DRAFT_414201 [Cercophora newfieldiana]|uniref:Uncharacterized protein n=1 Tax=Cercophora newfieldiana TaxID=92897 RepID=A0AA39Y7D7_9PEZI|nr:hypothetical protein B0T16DRAFT_414201 [Cercophora newfieldiana]